MVVLLAVLGLAWTMWGNELRTGVGLVMDTLRNAGPVWFFGAMAVLPLVGFPLAPFTFAAGPVFGPQMGVAPVIVCAVGAVTVNVALSYWISAKALRPLMIRVMTWLGRTLPEVPADSAAKLTFFVRVIPGTPFFVQNYLLGLARVPFGIYLAVSVAVTTAMIVVAILAGDALVRGDKTMLAIAGAGCAVVGLGMHLIRKKVTRMLRERRALQEARASSRPTPLN
ncbi:MAG: VTT domain-containing protein [Opitutaceae bacterium]|nr:VTT domain-containing protein [Opitutaceae bacterium]